MTDTPPNLASRPRRLAADLTDRLLFVLPLALFDDAIPDPVQIVAAFGWIALIVAQVVLTSRTGRSLGKRTLGLRVVRRETGENGGFVVNILRRNVLNAVFCLIPGYVIVDALFIFREDRRCLHDRLAGTIVVRDTITA